MVEIRFIPPISDREAEKKASRTSKFNTVGLYFAFELYLSDNVYGHIEKKIIASSSLGIEKIYFDVEEQFGEDVEYADDDEAFNHIDKAAIIEIYIVLKEFYPCGERAGIVKKLRKDVEVVLQGYLTDKLPSSGNSFIDFIECKWN